MRHSFRSLDGTRLAADLVLPAGAHRGIVLVHGGGVDRHEGGFFDRLADGLGEAGIASLRFDLRGHGQSGGRLEDLTLAGVGNDVSAAADELAGRLPVERVGVVGASFSGGVCAVFTARRPDRVDRLVLLNPLLDYKARFVDQKPEWHADRLGDAGARSLQENGYLAHSPTFRLGPALLNEVFWWDVRAELPTLSVPTLIVHGTADTFIPIESSRRAARALTGPHRLVELDGAQHGIAVPDDPGYADPRTRSWQSEVTAHIAAWSAVE
ncbi:MULTISPECIES: alpha/beta hydrolase [Pseudonocardia]|uniref:Non-heme chloroperoxidase n=2 Tax=Pseudonocardia TaxID=1847 RepID=A0A1Y2N2B0_PSEAH|nr:MULTISPECIES: alpha/beta fold hydrolase [Pseudonocardia]OSY41319.1 Non-heme chloroperoxidase [Pseudonocardia autotrophica]TDN76775.1 alpha-beta hydrolase superfamily lysophospholipase [Pseudonocardia autotrophica]BBG00776.1 alpha/beta hydrolase [Pseudonocardia autotrophica]GEC24258.1 alpha/beta hydrolase [Pseudonocardia saturnea]